MNRLSYRPISLDDFKSYTEFLADPDCTRYLRVPEPHSRELSRSLLERNVEQHDGTIGKRAKPPSSCVHAARSGSSI